MEPSPDASAPPAWRRGARAARGAGDAPSFGSLLRGLREARGLPMKDLGERAGLHQTFISRLESGERGPSREAVDALVDALDASEADRFRLLVAADLMVPLDPLLAALAEVFWSERVPPAARARLQALVEVAVAYAQAAMEPADPS